MIRSIQRMMSIAGKEWLQITRDRRSLILALIAPSMLILLFGYALTTDVKHVRLAIYDQDHTTRSRNYIEKYSHTEYFTPTAYVDRFAQIDAMLNSNRIDLALVIPAGFEKNIDRGTPVVVQVVADGTDSTSANVAIGYVNSLTAEYALSLSSSRALKRGINAAPSGISIEQRLWYNEEMQSKNYILPGLIALILAIICALIASLAVSREYERGTLETLLSTPLRPWEIVIGKIIPFLLVGLFDAITAFTLGYFLFDLPLKGSFLELIAISMLFLAGMSGMGILISTATRSQVLSVQLSMVLTYLPTFILSGFIFPVSNMPLIVQGITALIPARYLITVIKGIALKGVGSTLLITQILFLSVFCAVIITLTIVRFSAFYPYRKRRHD
jgi:ABC-2 type transport system permease protein